MSREVYLFEGYQPKDQKLLKFLHGRVNGAFPRSMEVGRYVTIWGGVYINTRELVFIEGLLRAHSIKHFGCRLDRIWMTKETKKIYKKLRKLDLYEVLNVLDNDNLFYTCSMMRGEIKPDEPRKLIPLWSRY